MSVVRWAYSKDLRKASLEDAQSCVGPGWADLVERAYEILSEQDDPLLYQVKEKFGGLRFYHSPDCPKIAEIEAKSYEVCEMCGAPGEPRTGGWVKTLCEEHHNA